MKKVILAAIVVITCVSLIGCGKTEKSKETQGVATQISSIENSHQEEEQPSTVQIPEEEPETVTPEEIEKAQEVLENIEVYSDDTKYVFKTSENTTGIFYHNGNEITGYEVLVDYDTHETAEYAKTEVLNNSDEEIESVTVEGKRLIIQYRPASYEELTLEGIEAAYSMFKVTKEGE